MLLRRVVRQRPPHQAPGAANRAGGVEDRPPAPQADDVAAQRICEADADAEALRTRGEHLEMIICMNGVFCGLADGEFELIDLEFVNCIW